MNNKIIKGTKKVEGLKLKLENVGKDLRKAIINDSKNQNELLNEYKKIQQEIRKEEEKIDELKRYEYEYNEAIQEEKREKKRKIANEKDEKIAGFSKRQEKIDNKLRKLEYDREECLQKLNILNSDLAVMKEKFSNAKKNGDIQELIEADEKLRQMKQEKNETDKKLNKVNSRLSINMLIKIKLNDKNIKRIKDTIIRYNEKAEKYGLEIVNLEEFLKERETFNQLEKIRKEQQNKYYKNKYAETIKKSISEGGIKNNHLEMIKQLKNKERGQIELESMQRIKDKKTNSFPIKTVKTVGKGIAKAAGTVVGVAILASKIVGKNAKKILQKIKRGANQGLTGANRMMLNGTTKLREKLENDAKTFENRREKLMGNIKTEIDENKAVENSEEKNKEQEKVEIQK